jgi:hypothetical protein
MRAADDAVADLDRLAHEARAIVALRVDDRLDLRRHLAQLVGEIEGIGAGAAQDGGDEDDEKRALPDLADGVRRRLGLDHAETLRIEGAGKLLAIAHDLIDYQDPVGRVFAHVASKISSRECISVT